METVMAKIRLSKLQDPDTASGRFRASDSPLEFLKKL